MLEKKAKKNPKKTLHRDEDEEEKNAEKESLVDPENPTADQTAVEIKVQRERETSIKQAESTTRMESPSNPTGEERRSTDDELSLSVVLKTSTTENPVEKPSTTATLQLSTEELSESAQRFIIWIQLRELIEQLQAREFFEFEWVKEWTGCDDLKQSKRFEEERTSRKKGKRREGKRKKDEQRKGVQKKEERS